ncbi:MAG TPA: hypothetical protein V6D29_19635 [Leptolyngbyaceae cyanobacterium]
MGGKPVNKVDLSALNPRNQETLLDVGDSVYYAGLDARIHYDYGGQILKILALDTVGGIAVCANPMGFKLVGVKACDLRLID